ncbi:FAD-dependent monooxygenase [Pseudalkalibacillus decolorationis]|uniref:FAD-dependent monooxygenase n=1 Tax=Pseudalkalibacillus decolorationis TaxID=163879 RepID=UPI002147EC9C|nr:FAD-dependent monooxygenase [Pseudalkalibacillus decolorationis]
MKTFETDVLIVGAGPTGLTLANELARHGIKFKIIDASSTTSKTTKALGVMSRTLELFEKTGITDELVTKGLPTPTFNVVQQDRQLIKLDFDKHCESPFPMVLMVPQNITEEVLYENLKNQGYDVEWETSLLDFKEIEEGCQATVRKDRDKDETITAKYIVGCDGAHSAVRHQLGFEFEGTTIDQTFALADIKLDWKLPYNQSYAFVNKGQFIAFFPMKDGRHRILMTSKEDSKQQEVTMEEIQSVINKVGPSPATISDPSWTSRFHVNQRKVKEARKGRIFLAGDAAHIHSPVGAQGMNTGIQDAFNLSWKLALVVQNHSPEDLLNSYAEERVPVWSELLAGTERVTRMLLNENQLFNHFRKRVAPIITSKKPVRQRLIGSLSEIGIHYRHSPLIDNDGKPSTTWKSLLKGNESIQAGDRAPDVTFSNDDRLFNHLKTTKHVLLIFTNYPQPIQHTITALDSLPIEVYQVGTTEAHERFLADKENVISQAYNLQTKNGFILIRPDGYIGYRSENLQEKELLDVLNHYFLGEKVV